MRQVLFGLALIAPAALLTACSEPDRRVLGKAVSPDGKLAITFYHEVHGSILDDDLVLTIDAAGAPYRQGTSIAGAKVATDLRAYWTADGQPVLAAKTFDGWIYATPSHHSPQLLVCVDAKSGCAHLPPPKTFFRVKRYRSGESGGEQLDL